MGGHVIFQTISVLPNINTHFEFGSYSQLNLKKIKALDDVTIPSNFDVPSHNFALVWTTVVKVECEIKVILY